MNNDPGLQEKIGKIIEQYRQVHDELVTLWTEKMVFTLHWWGDVTLAVVPWVVWLIVRDRKRTHSLLYAALFSMLMATILDMAGVSHDGWHYNTLLLPYFPEFLPWDLTVMPVGLMLFLQYFTKINPCLKGVAFGAAAAYIVEPIFIWLGMYEPGGWEHHYSLPIYFIIYMVAYWLYKRSIRECEKRT